MRVIVFSRQYISQLADSSTDQATLSEIIATHTTGIGRHLIYVFTIRGLHDLQNGFSFFLPLGIVGGFINYRYQRYSIPKSILLIVPLAVVFCLMSGNLGRMLFASSFIVIPYALICIEHVFVTKKTS